MNIDESILKSIARVISDEGITLGTAFVASHAGHVLTCWHVVEGLETVKIIFENKTEPIIAKVIHDLCNPQEDVAVLQVATRDITSCPLGIDWAINDSVWTYGYQYQKIVTSGYPVSGSISGSTKVDAGRELIVVSGGDFQKGLSGAPMLHVASGRVIGIVNARLTKSGVGFVIPLKTVLNTWPELNEHILRDKKQALDDVINLFEIMGYSIKREKSFSGLPRFEQDEEMFFGEIIIGISSIRTLMLCNHSYSEINENEFKDFAYQTYIPLYSQKLVENAFVVSVNNQPFSDNAKNFARSVGIRLVTYRELESNLINFSRFVTSYIEDFENYEKLSSHQKYPIIDQLQWGNLQKNYVDLRCRDVLFTKHDEDKLNSYIQNWLEDENRRHLSILGDYGSGKTSFCLQLVYTLARAYTEVSSNSRIPLFFPLRDYDPSVSLRTFILEKLAQYQVMVNDYQAFGKMAQAGRLLLIFDGFDELAEATDQQTAVKRFREINRLARGKSKVILTCRTEYFKTEAQSIDLLVPETMTPLMLELSKRGEYSVIELLEFNTQQILELVSRHTNDPTAYWNRIKSVYNLEDLATRPILLSMILQTYPQLKNYRKEVTPADLYQAYTTFWLERDKWRAVLSTDDRFRFAEELAWQMFLQATLAIQHDELLDRILIHFKDQYTREDINRTLETDIRTSSFLSRNRTGAFTFAHKSFMEFLVARRVAREIENNEFGLLNDKIVPVAVLSFLIHLITPKGIQHIKSAVVDSSTYSEVARATCMDFLLMLGETITHVPWVFCVGFSVDSKYVATGGSDCVVRVWEMDTMNEPAILNAHESWIRSIQFSPDEQFLATSSWDGTVKIWHIGDWSLVKKFELDSRIASIRYNAEGNMLAVGSYDQSIYLWDVINDELVHVIKDHYGIVWDVYFSPDGELLASACTDRIVRIWEVNTGKLVATLRGHEDAVSSVCFSNDAKLLFSGDWQGEIIAWDCDNYKIAYRLHAHDNKIGEIHVNPTNNHFASSADDQRVKLWISNTGDLVHVFSDSTSFTPNLQYSLDGRMIAVGSLDQHLRIWDVIQFKLLHEIKLQKLTYNI